MAQNRLPPEDRREFFETKVVPAARGGHYHWHIPSRSTSSFSWTEVINGQRHNFALPLRKAAWHFAGGTLLPGHCIAVDCGDARCLNPKHLIQVTFSAARMRMTPELRGLAGRSMGKNFTDDELRDIWLDADNLRGLGLARRYSVCTSIIWNIQKGKRNRQDIIRLFGPQIYWGQNRIRKYLNAKKNSTRNSTNTPGTGSLS